MDNQNDKTFVVSRFDQFDEWDRQHQAMRRQLKRKFLREVFIAACCAIGFAALYILLLQAI